MELPRIQGVVGNTIQHSRSRSKSSSPEIQLRNSRLNSSLKRFRKVVKAVKTDLAEQGVSSEQRESSIFSKMIVGNASDINLDSSAMVNSYFKARAGGLDRSEALRVLQIMREFEKEKKKDKVLSSKSRSSTDDSVSRRARSDRTSNQDQQEIMGGEKTSQSLPSTLASSAPNMIDIMTERIEPILRKSTLTTSSHPLTSSRGMDSSMKGASMFDLNPQFDGDRQQSHQCNLENFLTLPGISTGGFDLRRLNAGAEGAAALMASNPFETASPIPSPNYDPSSNYQKRIFSSLDVHDLEDFDEDVGIPRPLKRFADEGSRLVSSGGINFINSSITNAAAAAAAGVDVGQSDTVVNEFERSCLTRVKRKAEEEDYRADFESQEGVRDSKKRLKYQAKMDGRE